MSQLTEDLLQAKKEIATRGWRKGDLVDEKGRCCALGAIGLATIDGFAATGDDRYILLENSDRARAAITEVVKQTGYIYEGQDDIDAVYGRNDRSETTLEDVYQFFDDALASVTP